MNADKYKDKYVDSKRGKLKFSRHLKKNETEKAKAIQRNLGTTRTLTGPEGIEFEISREKGQVSAVSLDSAVKNRKATITIEESQEGRRAPGSFGSFCMSLTKVMLASAVPSVDPQKI